MSETEFEKLLYENGFQYETWLSGWIRNDVFILDSEDGVTAGVEHYPLPDNPTNVHKPFYTIAQELKLIK